ncbi:MAG: SET domain-containing protein [Acidobacteriaceae bacterium]|nr:SET domain-containing protein [Acidobacteriaceae bacterium]
MKWMREGGARFKNVRMRYYGPDFRGVHACGPINPSEVFLQVPHSLIITPQSGKELEIGAKILKANVKLNWDYLVYITIFLMNEMHNPESKWKPYLDVYPRLANGFPMFYSEYEKSLLKGTPMLEHIASETGQIKEEYLRILEAVPEFKKFTCEEYIRNKVLVVSRIFYVRMHSVTERIMVPLAGIVPRCSPRFRHV